MRIAYHSLLLMTAVGIVGCAPTQPAGYPPAPPMAKPTAATMPVVSPTAGIVKLPANAIQLCSGAYPPPSFPSPSKPGLIEIVDITTDKTLVVASYAVTGTGGDANKMMSINDVPNIANSIDKSHQYTIYFVPLAPGTAAP